MFWNCFKSFGFVFTVVVQCNSIKLKSVKIQLNSVHLFCLSEFVNKWIHSFANILVNLKERTQGFIVFKYSC